MRRKGIGRLLLETALAHGRSQGAHTAWLEVTSVNTPAIDAYRALGFELCGLDLSLYEHTAAEGEIALFMARPGD
jgi:ribosomal protein S18 acetylase RimI-like enzyme